MTIGQDFDPGACPIGVELWEAYCARHPEGLIKMPKDLRQIRERDRGHLREFIAHVAFCGDCNEV